MRVATRTVLTTIGPPPPRPRLAAPSPEPPGPRARDAAGNGRGLIGSVVLGVAGEADFVALGNRLSAAGDYRGGFVTQLWWRGFRKAEMQVSAYSLLTEHGSEAGPR
jgi:hypothetical protein